MKPSPKISVGNQASYYQSSFDAQMGSKAYDTINQSKNLSKNTSLDLKKLDLTKDPTESSSSLELLILLLNRSLKFSLQEILGLFTNNNKYLAHIIVKGIYEKFDGLRIFFQLLNQNIDTLIRLFQQNKDDGLACLYALKPGFISKDEKCAQLTINIFQSFGNEIYDWFISKESKCSQTLLLGLKRHQKLSQKYAKLLLSIIEGNQVEYFSTNFMTSTSSDIQFLQIISKLIPYFQGKQNTQSYESLVDKLEKNGVFEKWFQVGQKLYESQDIDNKIIFIDFIGNFMISLPKIVQKNASVTNLLRRNWQNYKMSHFITLVNQLFINLQRLALSQSPITKKLLNILTDIFNQTYHREQKRQFIVQGLLSVILNYTNIQLDIFLTNYPRNHIISTSDFMLIYQTVNNLYDQIKLIKIADFFKDLLFFDILNNNSLTGFILLIVKKFFSSDKIQVTKFINNLLKNILSNYVTLFLKSKNQLKIVRNQQQLNLNKRKKSDLLQQTEKSQIMIINKKMDLTIILVEKIIDIILSSQNSQNYVQTFKNYILITNSQIKKNNFGMGTKKLINLLQKKLKVTKQQQMTFQELNSNQPLTKSGFKPSQSLVNGKIRQNSGVISSLSRIQVPEKISKQFDAIVAKRKKDEQIRAQQEMKKKKQQELKKILHKKELQKMNLIKGGFGQGEAQLKQQGFWNRFVKQTQEVKIYLNHQIQDIHLQGAQLILKKYSKLFKYFFSNYSNTMYSSKTSNFEQNSQRKELLSAVEIIKLLKDYTLILATNLQQVQTMIKDINIKIFQRKQVVNEVDYEGFQEFIKQFCLCVWSRNQWRVGSKQNNLKFDHLTLPQLLMNFIIYLRNVFKVKGENMSLFDVGQVDHKTISPEVQQLNEKLQNNPNYILPEGFKKIADKKIDLKPVMKQGTNFSQSYAVTMQVLDELLFEKLGIHIIEPLAVKVVKLTAKPLHIINVNVKQKDPIKIKIRAMSTMIERKTAIHSSLGLMAPKAQFSKGIKKGMLSLKPNEKIIGQQVAYKLQQILNKVSQSENQFQESSNKFKSVQKLAQPQVRRSFSVHKIQQIQKNQFPIKQKLQIVEKSQTYILSKKKKKLQQDRKREEKVQLKLKRKKQEDEKYFVELKLKLEEKKSNQAIQFSKIRAAQQKERQKKRQKKLKISEFTSKQVEKYKDMFEQMIEKKKREQEEKEIKNQDEQEKMKKIRQKIESENKVLAQIRKQTTQAIMDILYGQNFKSLTKQYQIPLKAVFQYLQKHHANPLSKKKIAPGQIDAERWSKFNKIFEISPLIVSPKDVITIFKTVTKQKIAIKEHSVGLNYEEFLHCLLRECIKQKTIFGKIAERIKDQKANIIQTEVKNKKSKSVAKKIQVKNQFQEDEETDIKKLLKQSDIREDIIDHYGDVSKFNLESFRGLIFYLRMPFTRKGQQARTKQLIEMEKKQQSQNISNLQKLKEKLKSQYKLQRNQKKDTNNPQATRAQKTENKQQKSQSNQINSQRKPQQKQKNVNKPVDNVNIKKTQKK